MSMFLQVGYRSSLKSSQSISDLSSHIPEKHHRSNRLSTGNRSSQQNQYSTNPCKPTLNPKPALKPQQLINKIQGVGNALPKLELPSDNNCLSKSPTATKPTLSRPLTLTLKKTEKYKLSLNKTNHQSLPESPVCEELKLLKEQCKKDVSRFARFAQKRRSCSYFIGLDDNEENMDNIAKSFESLPAMNERNLENLKESLADDGDEGNANFSDDSLEGDFKNPPRRCVSDYQINIRVNDHRNYSNYQNFQRRILSGSQESILSDASVESFSKGSAEILDYNHCDADRHSSASFFLSRRKMQAGRSQDSILTDESDYQMFPLRENADHRSTESVLTDDSDSMVKSAPLEMLFDSHYKRKRQNSETYSGNPNNIVEICADSTRSSADEGTLCRAVFRSKSLQDTRINNAKNDMNSDFAEDSNKSPLRTRIYYEFSSDNDHKDDVNAAMCGVQSETISRSHSLKVPTKVPESMMILNDFVAHKPPKPKRNSSRTQSMRNRARPSWKYIDTPTLSPAPKSSENTDSYIPASSVSPTYPEHRSVRATDSQAKRDHPSNSDTIEQFLQSSSYTPEDDKDSRNNKFFSLPSHRNDSNVNVQGEVTLYDDTPRLTKNHYLTNIHDVSAVDGPSTCSEQERIHCLGNEIPTKDTGEDYDSLEASGILCNLQATELQSSGANFCSADERIDNLDASVDVRITRAIEGTVKLLSKEFENLVRQKQYFMKERCLRLTHCQETSENFAKLEAERDGRFYAIKRGDQVRLHSGGEDSDCADMSAMDRSLMESGSSTSASSCTNSPKRMWPPASRCQSHMRWTKTLPTINQAILPAKYPYTGIRRQTEKRIKKDREREREAESRRNACLSFLRVIISTCSIQSRKRERECMCS